jgi:hypothetical protein
VARAYRHPTVLSRLAETDDVDLNASVDPCSPAGDALIPRHTGQGGNVAHADRQDG